MASFPDLKSHGGCKTRQEIGLRGLATSVLATKKTTKKSYGNTPVIYAVAVVLAVVATAAAPGDITRRRCRRRTTGCF